MQQQNFTLVLDFDGVVFHGWHHNPQYRRDWTATITEDIGFNRADLAAIFGHPDFYQLAAGKRDLREFLAVVFKDIGYAGSIDDFIAYWRRKDTRPEHLNGTLVDYAQKLRNDHGISCYLATQQEPYRRRAIAETFNLDALFDGAFFTCDRGVLKFDPAFYQGIANDLAVDPDTLLYFDDSPEYMAAAKTAGWNGTVYNTITDFESHPLIAPLMDKRA
jgi:FMN phosphatase YigB (HAD superfamily)